MIITKFKFKSIALLLLAFLILCVSIVMDTSTSLDRAEIIHSNKEIHYTSEGSFDLDAGFISYKDIRRKKVIDNINIYNLEFWGSWSNNDRLTGSLSSYDFIAPKIISFYVSGYPNRDGNFLGLYCRELNTRFKLYSPNIGEEWSQLFWRTPKACIGKSVKIIAEDKSTDSGGWLGISTLIVFDSKQALEYLMLLLEKFKFLAILLLSCFLFLCPGSLLFKHFKIYSYVSSHSYLLSILCLSSFISYLLFWIYFINPQLGSIFSTIILFLSSVLSVKFILMTKEARRFIFDINFFIPLYILLCICVLYLFILYFPYPELGDASDTYIWTRFFEWMPPDNLIPKLFAEKIYTGDDPRNLLGDWLSSDRPPLQSAILLLCLPFIKLFQSNQITSLYYQTFGTFIQLFWIPAVFSLMLSLNIKLKNAVLVIIILATNGFFIFNSLFTWPKMLGASLSILALSILIDTKQLYKLSLDKEKSPTFILVLLSMFLGYLSHSSSIFLLPAIIIVVVWRFKYFLRFFDFSFLVISFSLTIVPWLLYKKLYNPPGDRLIKWFLGGAVDITESNAVSVILESYQKISFHEVLLNKFSNLMYILGIPSSYPPFNLEPFAMRTNEFFHILHSLGTLKLSLCIFLIKIFLNSKSIKNLRHLRSYFLLFPLSGLCIFLWILALYGNQASRATVHHGSYAVLILLFIFLSAYLVDYLLRAKYMLQTFLIFHITCFLYVWALATPPLMSEQVVLVTYPPYYAMVILLLVVFSCKIFECYKVFQLE